ncbi:MAG: helix-turn-helix transcriptional regulator [Aeromicrobium sp.]|uniref:hypothetical protein n=1 Tax=Aeromicrobium sp. TaxID=1871063 RepID=UPI0039E5B4FE
MRRRWVVREGADLTRAIGEVRWSRGLTQEALAGETGADRTRLARLERGATTKLLDLTVRLLRHLDATIVVEFDDEAPHG